MTRKLAESDNVRRETGSAKKQFGSWSDQKVKKALTTWERGKEGNSEERNLISIIPALWYVYTCTSCTPASPPKWSYDHLSVNHKLYTSMPSRLVP
jgi:hypothetical protein